jgi:hypothetical protein
MPDSNQTCLSILSSLPGRPGPPELDEQARKALLWASDIVRPAPEPVAFLAGGASKRRYLRLSGPRPLLLMISREWSEHLSFLLLGRQLWYAGLPLPRILAHHRLFGFFLLEDLGDRTLASLPQGPEREGAYLKAASLLARFHQKAMGQAAPFLVALSEPYSPDMVFRKEWSYFLSGLRLLDIPFPGWRAMDALETEGRGLAQDLGLQELREGYFLRAARPGPPLGPALIHRDYQSSNLMLAPSWPGGPERLFLLDWQGARLGPPLYDLASLLYDPYASLGPEKREALAAYYLEAREVPSGHCAYCLDRLRHYALMRLMQAFGAYARLWAEEGRKDYARYLYPAARSLGELSSSLSGRRYPILRSFLPDLAQAAKEFS